MIPFPRSAILDFRYQPSGSAQTEPQTVSMDSMEFGDTTNTLSATLTRTIDGIQGETVTLRELMAAIGEQGLLLLCALATLPFLFPVFRYPAFHRFRRSGNRFVGRRHYLEPNPLASQSDPGSSP